MCEEDFDEVGGGSGSNDGGGDENDCYGLEDKECKENEDCQLVTTPPSYSGSFSLLSSYSGSAAYSTTLEGTAELLVGATGISTSVRLTGTSSEDSTFKAHLHAAPCSADGGGHYQDPSNPGVVDAVGENWPEVMCDSSGVCRGDASNMWMPTDSALAAGLSIVVHDTPSASQGSGSKMLCADLVLPRVYSGDFSALSSYNGGEAYATALAGTAELVVGATGISTRVRVEDASASGLVFKAHLHAAPCSADGGGHYQDPSNPGVVDAVGENWPKVGCASNGGCGGMATNTWMPLEADLSSGLSIVIHDTPGSGSKMLCADLVAE